MNQLESCTLCPRQCKVDRRTKTGFCGAGYLPKVARAALHYWEEPCISGTHGSGTVFFSGCNLRCVFCQNYEISSKGHGKEISVSHLAKIFCRLQNEGAHNINLVSPTPYIPQIKAAIDEVRNEIKIPYVYNTGGYETIHTLQELEGYIDIYLTDIKYCDEGLSKKYSGAENYFQAAFAAAREMIKQTGTPTFDSYGIMQSGTIIRHLVMPGCRMDSRLILLKLKEAFDPRSFVLSLMSQYTPNESLASFPEIDRRITTFEYDFVVKTALDLGFNAAYTQKRSSADKKYTPPFDLSGV